MASAPKPKQKSSLPLLLGAGALLVLVVLMTGGDSSAPGTSASKTKRTTKKDADVFTPEDYSARFASFTTAPVDVFKPLVVKTVRTIVPPEKNGPRGGIPATLTGGEANWYYTGHVELNGDNEALLENTTSGESVYVKPGEGWKAARVQSIDVSSVVMVGPDGSAVSVPLQQYGETPGVKTPAVATNAPLNIPAGALTGAIGGLPATTAPTNGPARIVLSNGQTLDLAPATADASATNNGGNRRGRGRRNRNNSNATGDFNNAP